MEGKRQTGYGWTRSKSQLEPKFFFTSDGIGSETDASIRRTGLLFAVGKDLRNGRRRQAGHFHPQTSVFKVIDTVVIDVRRGTFNGSWIFVRLVQTGLLLLLLRLVVGPGNVFGQLFQYGRVRLVNAGHQDGQFATSSTIYSSTGNFCNSVSTCSYLFSISYKVSYKSQQLIVTAGWNPFDFGGGGPTDLMVEGSGSALQRSLSRVA